MPMPPYPVFCTHPACKHPAVYKIAARWSDGVVAELKTYGLYCDEHLREGFAQSRAKQAACRLTPGEILEPPGVFQLQRGERDQALQRLPDVEANLTTAG